MELVEVTLTGKPNVGINSDDLTMELEFNNIKGEYFIFECLYKTNKFLPDLNVAHVGSKTIRALPLNGRLAFALSIIDKNRSTLIGRLSKLVGSR
jgi:hypothetical protein